MIDAPAMKFPARFGYARVALARRLGWAAFLLLVAGAFVALVIYAEYAAPSPRETLEQRRMAQIAFLALAALCVAGAIIRGLRVRGEQAVEVIVDDEGLIYRRPAPRGEIVADVAIRWDAVESFTQDVCVVDYHGLPLRTIHRYTLVAADGQRLTLDDTIADVVALADRVAAETRPRLQPKLRRVIERGGTVNFGPLSVAREGLIDRGRLLPWERFGGIEVGRYGAIVIRERDAGGHWCRVAFAEVPNAHMLLPLAAELARPEGA